MSFGSEPGRDDGGLPPVHIVIPDDARELDRDVLAYRRERRARRRRERFLRLLRPFRGDGLGGHSTILPLIATCVALSMLAGAMLSVVTISPASAPTVSSTPTAPGTAKSGAPTPAATPAPGTVTPLPAGLIEPPPGTFSVDGATQPVRGLRSAALALVPPNCACDKALGWLAAEAGAARVGLYFVGEGKAIPQISALTTRDGHGVAAAAADTGNVLSAAYRPAGLTVVLIYSDGTSRVRRGIPGTFQFPPAPLHALTLPGR
ncbi:MAG TPA: hypothetical protein VF060_16945 [Trebonia sp.]